MMDAEGRTTVPNLFVAGEVGGGVQGRNRLGGNSLVDIFVFGRRAGRAAALQAKDVRPGRLTLDHVREYHRELAKAGILNGKVSPLLLPDYTNVEAASSGES